MRFRSTLAVAAVVLAPSFASAQVSVDGTIGAEWAGVTAKSVLFDANAPTSNFQLPGNENHITGYEIFMRRDANWLYTALRTTGGTTVPGAMWANLYYSLRSGAGPFGSTGQSIAFEITNNRAFDPNAGVYFNDNGSDLIRFASSGNNTLETAIDLSVFFTNALGIATYSPSATPVGIRLNLSQSFGYSVAGGQPDYGDERLGYVSAVTATPEPTTYSLMAGGLAMLGVFVRRRRSV